MENQSGSKLQLQWNLPGMTPRGKTTLSGKTIFQFVKISVYSLDSIQIEPVWKDQSFPHIKCGCSWHVSWCHCSYCLYSNVLIITPCFNKWTPPPCVGEVILHRRNSFKCAHPPYDPGNWSLLCNRWNGTKICKKNSFSIGKFGCYRELQKTWAVYFRNQIIGSWDIQLFKQVQNSVDISTYNVPVCK